MDRILLNNGVLWWNPKSAIDWGGGEIVWDVWFVFDGFTLHRADWTIRVKSSDYDDLWTIDFQTFANPDSDWGGILSKYYRTKTINLTLSIKQPTEEELDSLIDEIKYRTSKTEWYLDIYIWSFRRRRTATLTNLVFNRKNYNITRCGEVQLTFQCTNPHGRSKELKSLTFNWIGNDYTEEISYKGSAKSYFKGIFIVKTANATKFSITVNGYKQEIIHNITDWDVINYDWEEKEIQINWVNQKYIWPFVELQHGINNIRIEFDWSIDYDLSLIYKETYL